MYKISPSRFLREDMAALKVAAKDAASAREDEPVRLAIQRIMDKRHPLPVVSGKKNLCTGLLDSFDLLDFLGAGPKNGLFNKTANPLNIPVKRVSSSDFHCIKHTHNMKEALEVMRKNWRAVHPVLRGQSLYGLLSNHMVVKALDFRSFLGIKIRDVMVKKVFTVKEAESLYHAARMMLRGRFKRVPVADKGVILGMVTPRDVLCHLLKNRELLRKDTKATVSNAMNISVCSVGPDQDIVEAIRVMRRTGIGGLPVTEDRELLGIITEKDIIDMLEY